MVGTLRMPPLLQLHLIVLLVALTAVFGRLMSLEAPLIVLWRTLIAAVAMGVLLALTAPGKLRASRRVAVELLGIGVILGAHWLLFFGAVRVANVSVAVSGLACITIFTALVEPLIGRVRPRLSEVLLGGVVLVGLLVIGGFEREHRVGLLLAVGAALLAAVFPVLNRHYVRAGHSPRALMFYETIGAAGVAAIAVVAMPGLDFRFPAGIDWLWILLLALACTVFAHTWIIRLLRDLSAFTASLAFNFEPLYGVVLGAVLFREYERLHPGFYLGTLLILGANLLHPILERRRRRRRVE